MHNLREEHVEITYRKKALKVLRRMPANESRKIKDKIKEYTKNPKSLSNNITNLQDRDGFRLRVGEWRVIMSKNGEILDVLDVGPRGGIYGA